MKKIIIILVCLLLLAAGVPLFANGNDNDHGRYWKDNPHRWQGSDTHPAFHGYQGWGDAPSRCPADRPAPEPGDNPGEKPSEDPVDKPGVLPAESALVLNPFTGGFAG
jgi:hypothetical protein